MKRKIKWPFIIKIIILVVSIIIFIFSIIMIIRWKKDGNKTKDMSEEIADTTPIEETTDNENTEIIENKDVDEANPYWDYIKMNLMSVDFKELKKTNNDTAGWIEVKGTNVNYPFVQTSNNDFYLNHSFDKSSNSAGWVFLDYRNNIKELDKNTILYAHGRFDKTMFGTLRTITTNGWTNNIYNFTIRMSTEYENTLWQVFSIYKIPTNNDYIQTEFRSDSEFKTWASKMLERSSYNFNTTIGENDSVLTLSTCFDDNTKSVMHAKLIKKEKR